MRIRKGGEEDKKKPAHKTTNGNEIFIDYNVSHNYERRKSNGNGE